MRRVNSLPDVQLALNDINARLDRADRGILDMKGYRIMNTGPGIDETDVALISQLPKIGTPGIQNDQVRTIVWDNAGLLYTETGISELTWYRTGRLLVSDPMEFWVKCEIPPTDGSLLVNIEYQLRDGEDVKEILSADLEYEEAQTASEVSALFITPVPRLAEGSIIRPIVKQHGEAAIVSFGLVVKRCLV